MGEDGQRGDRSSHANLAKALAARGYVVATISYRLSGESPFPAQIHDCKAAVRFLRANASEYGIDPDKIGAIGLSAGGHLTALLATSGGIRELEGKGGNDSYSSTIQAAVPMGAQTHLLSTRNREISAMKAVVESGNSFSVAHRLRSLKSTEWLHHYITSTRATLLCGLSREKMMTPARMRILLGSR